MKTTVKVMLGAAALGMAASCRLGRHARRRQGEGLLQCGVNTGLAGFAAPNDKGEWAGFDVDYCRAVAAAIFGDPRRSKYTPTTAKDRFEVAASGEVDMLARNTTWTLSRDTDARLQFRRRQLL